MRVETTAAQMTPPNPIRKTHYSETEAAKVLGITVSDFRSLIETHIVDSVDDVENVPRASFHPSDILVLRLLAGSETASSA
jgi:hypothetical protein